MGCLRSINNIGIHRHGVFVEKRMGITIMPACMFQAKVLIRLFLNPMTEYSIVTTTV